MKDQFEKFVEDNREGLDAFEPRRGLWESVEEKLSGQKEMKRLRYYVAAASVVLVACLAVWLIPKSVQKNNIPLVETPALNPDINKAEVYYASMIQEKRTELNRYCRQQPGLCNEFEKELDTLTVLYGQLKMEYNSSAQPEVVLLAMINNLQVQLQVLSQQLQILQKVHARKEETHVGLYKTI